MSGKSLSDLDKFIKENSYTRKLDLGEGFEHLHKGEDYVKVVDVKRFFKQLEEKRQKELLILSKKCRYLLDGQCGFWSLRKKLPKCNVMECVKR